MEALKDAVETMKTLGIRKVKLGPETMGKLSQFGSLGEVLSLCGQVEQIQPAVDWAHLHARCKGCLKTIEDFREVEEENEKRLGKDTVETMHCHFTKVEFTEKAERRHHTMGEVEYGPDFEMLAKVIAEFKLKPVVISESPVLDVDPIKMRDILQGELKN